MKRIVLFLIFFLPLAHGAVDQHSAQVSTQIRFPVEKYVLDNGLTVLIHEDHSLPILSFHQWFRVGSKDEQPGRTGLAHFFEHLMFKGTTKYDGDEFDRMIQANGGSNNAFTSKDYTGYYVNLPSDKLELAIDIESDRMRNLVFDQKEIDSEREVVKEERRFRVDNSIMGFLNEQIFATVFKVHPYKWPVIGYMKDLNAASMDDMKEFYRVHYAPNNAVVVIAGAVSASKAKKLVDKYYGNIPSQRLPERKFAQEPKQSGGRIVNLTRSVQAPMFAVLYPAPKAGEADAFTLDLLSNIMSNGNSSRLYNRLVYRSELLDSISTSNYTPQEPGLFQIIGTMKPGADMEKALNAVYGELYRMRTALVSDLELEKAKNQVMFDYVSGLKTIAGKAQALAANEIIFGDYSQMFKDLARYQSVTKEDIKSAASRYLMPEQRSLVRVRPPAAGGN